MIKLVCPVCKKDSDRARTTLVIKAFGDMRIVPNRDGPGVERAVATPLQASSRRLKVEVVPETMLTCGQCGEETPSERWRYTVACDHCGNSVTRRSVATPNSAVDDHICRDAMSLYCDRCWSQADNEYCPECRYREGCVTYNDR